MRWIKFLFHRGQRGTRRTENLPAQRRARRVSALIPVLLYGRFGDKPFHENTETIDVSEHGGLVTTSVKLIGSQKLILTNVQTNEDVACRVARLVQTGEGHTLAGLEFLQPSPRFWGTIWVPDDEGSAELRRS